MMIKQPIPTQNDIGHQNGITSKQTLFLQQEKQQKNKFFHDFPSIGTEDIKIFRPYYFYSSILL